MREAAFSLGLTPEARRLLRPGEALVFDWHRVSFCCAGAGETSLYAMKEAAAKGRKSLVRLKSEAPVYAARPVLPHLSGRVTIDGRKTLGVRRFTSDLPDDLGLRAAFGRLPDPESAPR